MNNCKIVSIKTTSAIFLAIVLVTGTFALSYSSFMTEAQATSDREKHNDDDDRKSYKKDRDKNDSRDHDNDYKDDDDKKSYGKDNNYELIIDNKIDNKYGKPYENDNTYYESQYQSSYKLDYKSKYSSYDGKDNNNIYKSKERKSVNVKKINCNNINVNINGGQGANNGNTNNGNNGNGDNSNDERNKTNNGFKKFNKKDGFEFVCVNNNDNRQITPTPQPAPPPIDNNVYAVWQDDTLGNNEIFFTASNNNGQTFSSPINLSNNTGDSLSPKISTSGDNVYVVWIDFSTGNEEIFFTVSHDNGKTFSTPDNLSDNTGFSEAPQITSEGNNVYVVWVDTTPGNQEIFFTASNNNGQTFSSPDNISNSPSTSFEPQISSEEDNVYVVWADFTSGNGDIFFTASNNNGQTFSTPPDNLSDNTGFSFTPQITSEENNVYVVWQDDTDNTAGTYDIFFTASNNNGQTFSTPPDNLSDNDGISREPQITSEGNNVYVVWSDNTLDPFNFDIFFTTSNNNGQTFSTPPDNLSDNDGFSEVPQITSEGNNVYVVWSDTTGTTGDRDIFFTASNNNGQTFSTPPDNLSDNDGESTSPQISSEGNNVYVIWDDSTPGNPEIFFTASNNNGQTFSTPPDNLSDNEGTSAGAQISSSTS